MTSPAGWYPDPSGKPMQRYFDGDLWTDYYAPAPPPVAGVVMTGGENHVLHGVLTLITCGGWLLIWLLIAATEKKRPAAVDMYGNIIATPRLPVDSAKARPPAWIKKFSWLEKLPGDPMFWVILISGFSAVALIILGVIIWGQTNIAMAGPR